MGNKPKPKPQHQVTPRPISEEQGAGGEVAIDEVELPTWTVVLEDITSAAERLRPGVAVRGERSEPRFRVYAGNHLIGFLPVRESDEIRSAIGRGSTRLLGSVSSVDLSAAKVEVRLRLEGL